MGYVFLSVYLHIVFLNASNNCSPRAPAENLGYFVELLYFGPFLMCNSLPLKSSQIYPSAIHISF